MSSRLLRQKRVITPFTEHDDSHISTHIHKRMQTSSKYGDICHDKQHEGIVPAPCARSHKSKQERQSDAEVRANDH